MDREQLTQIDEDLLNIQIILGTGLREHGPNLISITLSSLGLHLSLCLQILLIARDTNCNPLRTLLPQLIDPILKRFEAVLLPSKTIIKDISVYSSSTWATSLIESFPLHLATHLPSDIINHDRCSSALVVHRCQAMILQRETDRNSMASNPQKSAPPPVTTPVSQ